MQPVLITFFNGGMIENLEHVNQTRDVHEPNLEDSAYGLPTFRYALAHHKPESITAFPPGKKKEETCVKLQIATGYLSLA